MHFGKRKHLQRESKGEAGFIKKRRTCVELGSASDAVSTPLAVEAKAVAAGLWSEGHRKEREFNDKKRHDHRAKLSFVRQTKPCPRHLPKLSLCLSLSTTDA